MTADPHPFQDQHQSEASAAELTAARSSGLIPDEPPADLEWDLPAPSTYTAPADPTTNGHKPETDDNHSTWWPHNLAGLFDGSIQLPEPQLCTRTDGQPHHAST